MNSTLNAGSGGRNRLGCTSVVALSVLGFAAGCSRPQPVQSQATRPVKTLVVAAGENLRQRLFSGRVEASRSADLAFSVSGVLVQLPIKEGQKVVKGELIAQLREEEFKARLRVLQGQLDQARAGLRSLEAGERPEERLRREAQVRASAARLANAQIEFERNERMLKTQAVSRAEFDRAETMYRVAQEDHKAALQMLEMGAIGREEDIDARAADVRSLEGRVDEAGLQLRDTTIRAPFDGVIARRFVDVQQNVRAKEPVVRFQDANEIDIAVDVPEALMMSDIRNADIVQMFAELSGAPGLQIPVRIREISQVADPTTQTFNVRVALTPPPGVTVLPGMTATVSMTYRRASTVGNRLLVPISAVYKDSSGQQVAWVLEPDQTVSRRPVKTGQATGGRIEIVDGLQPGNRIAIAGVSFLRDGMKVRDLGDALGGTAQ